MSETSQISDFCDELRRAREFQGLSLSRLAAQTKISLEYLEALEAGRLEQIPTPIRRGVVAAYARAAGMNVDKVLSQLQAIESPTASSKRGQLAAERSRDESMTIGMTRAQIRTAWFAKIAANRPLHWGLSLFLLVGAFLINTQIKGRDTGEGKVAVAGSPDTLAFHEGPYRLLRMAVFDSLLLDFDFPTKQTKIVATDTMILDICAGLHDFEPAFVYPYDTIEFMHRIGLRIAFPTSSLPFVYADLETLRVHYSADSTETWVTSPDYPPTDSLGSDTSKTAPKG